MTQVGGREGATIIVLMGVSGSGKTTIAKVLSDRLGWPFRDADEFHPQANIDKMAGGTPLTDEDRWPWLRAIAAWIDEEHAAGKSAIVTCSALKRSYRAVIVGARAYVRLVYLQGSEALLASRLAGRHGHFMPPALLRSQLDDLEEPGPDEHALTVSVAPTPDEIADDILRRLKLR
jgi:gluconokinase